MSNAEIPTHSVSYGRETILFTLKLSNRKTLSIDVNPDLSVEVSAPQGKDLDLIKSKVHKRAPWILKQKDYFRGFLPTIPARQYVSGETHYYLGRQYRLKVIQADAEKVKLKGQYIYVFVADKTDRKRIESLFKSWLLAHARNRFQITLEKSWEKVRRHEITFPKLIIRKMSKRWGSCSSRGVIYLNIDLVKAPSHCIEYVIIHELCHLKHPNHSNSFFLMLNRIMPDWEKRKERLEKVR